MIFSLFFALIAQASDLNCRAIYRTLDENQKGIEETTPLLPVFKGAKATRYEAELRGKFFSIVDENGDLLAQVTTAPNYTKGSVSKGRLDSTGRFSLAEVDGATVHRLECRGNSRR